MTQRRRPDWRPIDADKRRVRPVVGHRQQVRAIPAAELENSVAIESLARPTVEQRRERKPLRCRPLDGKTFIRVLIIRIENGGADHREPQTVGRG